MRALLLFGTVSLAALSGCGLENLFGGAAHKGYQRPASIIRGMAPPGTASTRQLWVTDGDGAVLNPFRMTLENGQYELRLPSATYTNLVVHVRIGAMELRTLVPAVGEEMAVNGVDLDAAAMTEMLIAEARLSNDSPDPKHRALLKQLTPSTYLATRGLIRAGLATAGPTQELFLMVERLIAKADPALSPTSPYLFNVPVLDGTFLLATGSACGLATGVICSALDATWLAASRFDYTGDSNPDPTSAAFDAKLIEVAKLYRPGGCPDPDHIRLMFTVDFTQGAKGGDGRSPDRFRWATDKPGKSMFFVGWIYTTSACGVAPTDFYDTGVANAIGNSTPNVVRMYDDGTNGDEAAGDGIWTVYFDVPRSSPGRVLRLGYKYTWGFLGAQWSGSEEWPGNGRLLEVVDVNGDGIVYRRDVFADEATNKDCANALNGSITWTTDLHGCGPESHEQMFTLHDASTCGTAWNTPQSVGPITIACTGP